MQQLPQAENFVNHFFWIALPVILTTITGQLVSYFANKRRGDEKDRKRAIAEAAKEARQAVILENFGLHRHDEEDGPLYAHGITFPAVDKTR